MEVVAGRAAGRAHSADLLPAGDVLPFADQDGRHVAVAGGDAPAMVDFNEIAVTAVVPAGAEYRTVRGGVDRRAIGAGKVDARVHRGTCAERIRADAEATGEFDAGLDRLVRRNRDNAILQLVELLPAVEQVLEGRIRGRFERAANAARAADTRLRDTETLQVC